MFRHEAGPEGTARPVFGEVDTPAVEAAVAFGVAAGAGAGAGVCTTVFSFTDSLAGVGLEV